MVRVCVLFAAGTNCDQETIRAFELAGACPERVHVNQLKSGERRLSEFHLLAIPGGFSYGDYISSGRILANELKHNLADAVAEFHRSGKPIIGICNGFQVLVKAGLLPAFDGLFETQTVTLDTNDSGRFEARWIRLVTAESPCIFTRGFSGVIELPVAHAEGKFIPAGNHILQELQRRQQVVFRYSGLNDGPVEYPDNPNGSIDDIAGICDPSGLIFGLMPHPERFTRLEHHPEWHRHRLTRPHGIGIFENAVRHCRTHL